MPIRVFCVFTVSRPTSVTRYSVFRVTIVHGDFDGTSGCVMCATPSFDATGDVIVDIALNGHDFTADLVRFSYYESPNISNVDPPCGPAHGGTVIKIHGLGLRDVSGLEGSLCARFTDFDGITVDVPAALKWDPSIQTCSAHAATDFASHWIFLGVCVLRVHERISHVVSY